MRLAFALGLGLGLAIAPQTVRADDSSSQDVSPKRPVPNYDGRGTPSDGANAGTWTARVVLSPLYFVSEYVIRRPFDALMDFLEQHDRLTKLYDFFAFGPDHKIGFAPIGFVEFGFNPSVGVYGFWNDAFTTRNSVTMHIEAWPSDWLAATFTDRYVTRDDHVFQLRAVGVNRPDQVFYGVGPDSMQSAQSRYREARADVSATVDAHVWRSTRIKTWAGAKRIDLSDGHYGSDPSVGQEARSGAFPLPFGFNRGYAGPYGGVDLALDTRAAADPRSGMRLELHGDVATDLEHGSSGWVHYGAALTGYWDLDGHGRILSLSAGTSFADPLLPRDSIPFTELVQLGDHEWMAGYFPGRLRDRSAAVAMLRYDWPIASWIDGTLQAVVGDVFHEHLEGFDPGLFRFSGAIGITTTTEFVAAFAGATQSPGENAEHKSSSGPRLEILAGFGTDTFDRGATVQSFHIAFGVPHAF